MVHAIRWRVGSAASIAWWEDRLARLGVEALRTDAVKVRGCASQVWLVSSRENGKLAFVGDSDALIVRGLIAILLRIYAGKTPAEILALDAKQILATLGLDTHLSQQRSNGLFSMVERIRADARAATSG